MRRIAMFASVGLVLLAGAASGAESMKPGQADYLRYCASCHGDEGKGDGIVAGFMTPKPTDLTQLTKAHGGTYPLVAVRESIDGRKQIQAHGSSEMPVWGEVFSTEKAMAQHDAHVRGKVQGIASFVGTLQAK